MPIELHDLEIPAKKKIHIIYVLDTSASMTGIPITVLNDAMRSVIEELRQRDGERIDVHIAVLEYNSDNRWVTQGNDGFERLQDFCWVDLEATGMTCFGGALRELNSILLKMRPETCNRTPIVIFTSDGCPTDDWREELRILAENKWYCMATKFAFAIGDQADPDVLANVVGVTAVGQIKPNHNAVIKINNLQEFPDILQMVSVSSCVDTTFRAPLCEHYTPDFLDTLDPQGPLDTPDVSDTLYFKLDEFLDVGFDII